MSQQLGKWSFVPAVLVGLVLTAPAAAGPTVPHKESCSGTITGLTVNGQIAAQTFAGVGNATHLGRYRISGGHQLNLATGQVLNGRFTSIAADGSTISGSYSGTFTEISPGVFQFKVHVLYTTGAGRLAGVTGAADTVAIVNGSAPGSTFTYSTLGTLTFP
jgi:hypothetical protein